MSQNDVIDIEELKKFTGSLGDKELLGFITHFEEDLTKKIDRFTGFINSEEYSETRNIAHSLKSTATLIGANALCSISANFEKKVDLNNLTDINVLANSLISEAGKVLHAVAIEKKKLSE